MGEKNLNIFQELGGEPKFSPFYGKELIEAFRRTVAKDANDDEFAIFMHLANKYGLDPAAKQIWFTKWGDQSQIFTGRDGFLEIAHRSGKFDGMESGTVGSVEEGNLKGWCRVYRKDMSHPFYVEVDFAEYNQKRGLWQTKPKTMIQKVAESQCLRRAFGISGIYAPEEIDTEHQEEDNIKEELATRPEREAVFNMAKNKNISHDELRRLSIEITGKESSHEWTTNDIENMAKAIEKYNKHDNILNRPAH